jgi:Txe/YoeB family toxin of Txe-Axe toxin-antitoxin module
MVELLNITGRLWPYSCCLFATFVMRYFDFAEKYPTHIITKTFNQKLRLFGIAISDVRSWSEAVRDDFERRNRRAVSIQSVESLTNVIRVITEDTNKIIGTLETVTSSLSALSARVDSMEKIVHTVHDLQVVLASSRDVTMTPTPTRKRSLASMEDQEEGVLNSTTTVAPASRESSRPLRPLLVLHGNSLKDYDMGNMLCDYILHDVKIRQVADPRVNKDNVRRMNIVYDFLMSCASKEEKRLLLGSSIPELDDPDYTRWLQSMRNTCMNTAMYCLLQIEEEVFGGDKTTGAKKALVTGVERRITFLKSKFNVHVVSYQLKSERGRGVLDLAISSSAVEK